MLKAGEKWATENKVDIDTLLEVSKAIGKVQLELRCRDVEACTDDIGLLVHTFLTFRHLLILLLMDFRRESMET